MKSKTQEHVNNEAQPQSNVLAKPQSIVGRLEQGGKKKKNTWRQYTIKLFISAAAFLSKQEIVTPQHKLM